MLPPDYDNAFKYWERPGRRATGDPSEWPLHASVGEALTEWEFAEMALGRLFGVLTGSSSVASVLVYATIKNAVGRKEALQQAGRVFFEQQERAVHKKDFEVLLRHYGEASGRRSDIAHGITVELADETKTSNGFYHIPPELSVKNSIRFMETGKTITSMDQIAVAYAFVADDVREFCRKFVQFQSVLVDFLGKLRSVSP